MDWLESTENEREQKNLQYLIPHNYAHITSSRLTYLGFGTIILSHYHIMRFPVRLKIRLILNVVLAYIGQFMDKE